MYPLDMVVSLTGLNETHIHKLEKEGIVKPKYRSGMKYYTFTDIYVFKITAIAKRRGIQFKNIRYAYDCLKSLKPDRDLSSFSLYHDGKEILDFTDDLKIIASKYGQIVDEALVAEIKPLAIGSELELTRNKFLSATKALKARRKEVLQSGVKTSMEEIDSLLYG
jgi:DNA-binding transcriptional MerR regulator